MIITGKLSLISVLALVIAAPAVAQQPRWSQRDHSFARYGTAARQPTLRRFADPNLYDVVAPDPGGSGCSPVHTPLCSNICTGTGPCAPADSW
jgi:pimeloyl-ACP methyl ester carboxylesterase